MRKVKIAALALLALTLASAAGAEMVLSRSEFARSVFAREPDGVAQNFPPDVGEVFFFNQLTGVAGPTIVKHVWIFDNAVQMEVKLEVEGEGWRVWSSKKISAQQSGNWNVEVLDSAGNVLESATFTVGR